MITYDHSKFWLRPWFMAALGGAVLAGGVWVWQAQKAPDHSTDPAPAPAGNGWVTAGTSAMPNTSATAMNRPVWTAEGRPADMPEQEWNTLYGALAKVPNVPDAKAEAARIVDYLRYQRRFEYWQSTEGQKSAKERAGLAQALLDEIPDRLAKNEFTAAEAVMMQTVLLSEIETDEARKQQRIAEGQERLLKLTGSPANEVAMREAERLTEYKRTLATTFAEWQSKPENVRTPATLEQAMAEAVRQFNAGHP